MHCTYYTCGAGVLKEVGGGGGAMGGGGGAGGAGERNTHSLNITPSHDMNYTVEPCSSELLATLHKCTHVYIISF